MLTSMAAVWVIASSRARARRTSGPSIMKFMGIIFPLKASLLRAKRVKSCLTVKESYGEISRD